MIKFEDSDAAPDDPVTLSVHPRHTQDSTPKEGTMKHHLTALLATILAALVLTAAASASTLDDLTALGFTVAVSGQTGPGCTTYSISGFGVQTYANNCSDGFQATIDALANPTAQCNRVWQFTHPDQLAALTKIGQKGYAVSGDQCADAWTIQIPATGAVVYQGAGGGLVSAAASLADLTAPAAPTEAAAPTAAQPTATAPVTGGFCLPLCPTAAPAATPAAAPAAPAMPSTSTAISTAVAAAVADAPAAVASTDAMQTAVAGGATADVAALAARSAGLNVTYGLGA